METTKSSYNDAMKELRVLEEKRKAHRIKPPPRSYSYNFSTPEFGTIKITADSRAEAQKNAATV